MTRIMTITPLVLFEQRTTSQLLLDYYNKRTTCLQGITDAQIPFIHTVLVDIERDEGCAPPWQFSDGHGPVSDWRARDSKRPGERVLASDRDSCRFYGWQAAVRLALKDGWGASAHISTAGLTKRQIAELAVDADYRYLKAWCNDEWEYVTVTVAVQTHFGRFEESLSGVETYRGADGKGEYISEVVQELYDTVRNELAGVQACPTCGGCGKVARTR